MNEELVQKVIELTEQLSVEIQAFQEEIKKEVLNYSETYKDANDILALLRSKGWFDSIPDEYQLGRKVIDVAFLGLSKELNKEALGKKIK